MWALGSGPLACVPDALLCCSTRVLAPAAGPCFLALAAQEAMRVWHITCMLTSPVGYSLFSTPLSAGAMSRPCSSTRLVVLLASCTCLHACLCQPRCRRAWLCGYTLASVLGGAACMSCRCARNGLNVLTCYRLAAPPPGRLAVCATVCNSARSPPRSPPPVFPAGH